MQSKNSTENLNSSSFNKAKPSIWVIIIYGLLVVALVIVGIGIARKVIDRNKVVKDPFFYLNGEPITKLEYNFYYNSVYRKYISSYSMLFDYMEVDSEKPLEEQPYDDERTFKQFFEDSTIEAIKKMHALWDEGHSVGFEADIESDYNSYLNEVVSSCNAAGISTDDYFSKFYGQYAKEKNIKPFLLMQFYADKYSEFLANKLNKTETDTAAYEYIEELKKGYEVIYP